MKSIYLAANVTDAHLVRNLLEQSGVEAYVRGEHLQGGLGELPVNGPIEVCVDAADVDGAKDVLARWRRGDFALPDEEQEPDPVPVAPSRWWTSSLLAFCIGGAAGALLVWLSLAGPTQEGVAADYDEDGIVDERPFFSGDLLVRVDTDRNRDGRADMVTHYEGQPADRAESDENFDGRMETRHRYLRNVWADSESDFDGDGATDYRIEANAGVVAREQWLDPEGKVVKQVLYKHGRRWISELDRDGDGSFEVRRELDAIGEPLTRN